MTKHCNVENTTAEESVDYSSQVNWIAIGKGEHAADVFYLYPTAWFAKDGDGVVNTIDNASMRERAPEAYRQQASCFEAVADVYAPFYRQVNALMTLGMSLSEQEALVGGTPYRDAVAAFEYFLEHYNRGRPFILAGHSQGANVLKFLLSRYMKEHPDVYARMVAAYPLGYSFEKQFFEANPHLKFVEGETDTQVVVTWNCERMQDGRFGSGNLVCHPGALSVNPISWTHDEEKVEADDPRQLGALQTNERYSAQVRYDSARGYEVLVVGMPTQPDDERGIGEFALHGRDFPLYYYNIRENALKRIQAFETQR